MPELFHPDRLQRLAGLRARGVEPYPSGDPSGREWAAEAAAAVDSRAGETATVSGRILGRRGYGKLAFLDLYDQSGKIQACLQKDRLSEGDYAILKEINRGDFVQVTGALGRTKLGEPTLFATSFGILSKALLDPPEKWHGLADMELRARLRYVDLFSNPEVRERFLKRSRLIAAMRTVFQSRGYTEVETPVLHPVYGGAAARPFRTHHNTLDMDLFLRIAPELYLKRLLVGGIERVFEFARVFRNEGISPRHNPEFTMLEFYEAFSNYQGMAGLTEELLVAAADAANGRQVRFRGGEYSLEPPFRRLQYAAEFERMAGFDPSDRKAGRRALERRKLEPGRDLDSPYGYWKAVNDLFEEEVEPGLGKEGPVFVQDYPAVLCPLARPCSDRPEWAQRWELFLGGIELANAFSELNDPQLQLARFEEQVAQKDPELPSEVDLDYVRALAYGLPPAGGCGIGIDRLAMILLQVDNIREILLFPLLRREQARDPSLEEGTSQPTR